MLAKKDPLLLLKPKPSALDVKSNLLTVKSNPPTVKPGSSNTLMSNAPIGPNPPGIINENDFKVKDATIKKDNKAAIKDEIQDVDTETLKKVRRRKK